MAEAPAGTDYAKKPWLKLYTGGLPERIEFDIANGLSLFRAAAAAAPDRAAILYFDGAPTYRELDEWSDALAVALIERGFEPGDRLALYLQNMPAFLIGTLAAWKAGGIAVTLNPMNRQRELTQIFADSEPKALIAIDQLETEVVEALPPKTFRPSIVVTARPRDFQTRNDPRIFGGLPELPPGPNDLMALCSAYRGRKPPMLTPARGGHRVPRLHVGHDRRAEGRDDHARQFRLQRAIESRSVLAARRRPHLRAGAAVPHHRPRHAYRPDVLVAGGAADPGLPLRARRRARRPRGTSARPGWCARSPPSSR